MRKKHQITLDNETSKTVLRALYQDREIQAATVEELAVMAERGMGSLSDEECERMLYTMCNDIDGASGAVDVFRLLEQMRVESSEIDGVGSEPDAVHSSQRESSMIGRIDSGSGLKDRVGQSEVIVQTARSVHRGPVRIEGVSGVLGVLWGIAACMVLYFGVWAFSESDNVGLGFEQPPVIGMNGEGDIDVPRHGVSESANEPVSGSIQEIPVSDGVHRDNRGLSGYLFHGSLLIVVVLPPVIMMTRSKRAR